MFYPQKHALAHDVVEHGIARLQAQEVQVMTPGTPFAVLAERCGLSQREAAEFLKVRIDTIKSWCAGRNVAKPTVLAELRELYAKIQAAADKLAQNNERLLELQARDEKFNSAQLCSVLRRPTTLRGPMVSPPRGRTWRRLALRCCDCPMMSRSRWSRNRIPALAAAVPLRWSQERR